MFLVPLPAHYGKNGALEACQDAFPSGHSLMRQGAVLTDYTQTWRNQLSRTLLLPDDPLDVESDLRISSVEGGIRIYDLLRSNDVLDLQDSALVKYLGENIGRDIYVLDENMNLLTSYRTGQTALLLQRSTVGCPEPYYALLAIQNNLGTEINFPFADLENILVGLNIAI